MKQEGGLGDRKMHGSFKLLLLSPSGTRAHANTYTHTIKIKKSQTIPFTCFLLNK